MPTNQEIINKLNAIHACYESIEWISTQVNSDWQTIWNSCERGDWMLWLLGKLSGPVESDSRKKLVLCCCECASLALPFVKSGEKRPLTAIGIAEKYARNEVNITLADVRNAAADDAAAAYAAAAYTADAAVAYTAAAYAAAAYAAYAAAAYTAAYAAERKKILSQCANIVRRHYPIAPEL